MTRTISIFFFSERSGGRRGEELTSKAHQKPITTSNALEWLSQKKLKITNVGKCTEKLGTGTLVPCWWEYKMVWLLWKTASKFHKRLHRVTLWPTNSTTSIRTRELKTRSHKNLYKNIHGSISHNNQKVEATQMSNNWRTNKQNVVCPYKGVLLGRKKGWGTDTCYNKDEPCNHAKWKKPVLKDHMLHNAIYTKYLRSKSIETSHRGWWLPADRGKGELGLIAKSYRTSFGDDRNVLKLDYGDGCTR